MQRNTYRQIGLEFGRLVEHDICQAFYKPVRKRAHLLKFQRHRANQRIHVASEAARAVDVEWFCAARKAKALAWLGESPSCSLLTADFRSYAEIGRPAASALDSGLPTTKASLVALNNQLLILH